MINFTTKQEYQGSNIDELNGLGTEFCTFRQAIDFFKLSGKELKGAKIGYARELAKRGVTKIPKVEGLFNGDGTS